LTERIVRAAGDLTGATVIEVGPGPGGLTRALLGAGARVIAVEKDIRIKSALAPLVAAAGGRLTLIEGDALEVDERRLLAGSGAGSAHIVANLPYNVATPLIVKWLAQLAETPGLYTTLVQTLQKEVAERLVAVPRTKAYGRLSVMCQWLTEADIAFTIGARAFTPPPKVESAVVRLVPRSDPPTIAFAAMEAVARAAFGQRRKMLRTSLRALGVDTPTLLAATGIPPTARAEELSIADYQTLAQAFVAAREAP
jgi:16S rRNA (adenine1518-N6/adenine1519-N6)-dimethyltransferase